MGWGATVRRRGSRVRGTGLGIWLARPTKTKFTKRFEPEVGVDDREPGKLWTVVVVVVVVVVVAAVAVVVVVAAVAWWW